MDRTRLLKTVIPIVVIGGALGYLLFQSLQSSYAYYYSVDEFIESPQGSALQKSDSQSAPTGQSSTVRLAGMVKKGSIAKIADLHVDFQLAGNAHTIPVTFRGVLPKNFEEDKEVVIEGKLSNDGVFKAGKIMTRCESKYKVKLDDKVSQK